MMLDQHSVWSSSTSIAIYHASISNCINCVQHAINIMTYNGMVYIIRFRLGQQHTKKVVGTSTSRCISSRAHD
jgi:hypothetical protein